MDMHFIRTGTFNANRLARMCKIIKGSNTAAEFAKSLDVNPSTISRILNGKIVSPISDDTMVKIANLITPEMQIKKELFFEANGCALDDGKDVIKKRLEEKRVLQNKMKSILQASLINSNLQVSYRLQRTKYALNGDCVLIPDYVVLVDCEDCLENEKECEWAVDFSLTHTNPNKMDLKFFLMRVLQKISMYSLLSYQQGLEDNLYGEYPNRYSIVTHDMDYMNYLKKNLDSIITPIDISLILVDLAESKVVQEHPLRRTYYDRASVLIKSNEPYFNEDGDEISEKDFFELLEDEIDSYIKGI